MKKPLILAAALALSLLQGAAALAQGGSARTDFASAQELYRSGLYAVQTPQVFQVEVYKAALEAAIGGAKDKKQITDDCSAAEAYGVNVVITPGSDENFKVTTPTDLVLAEAILAARNKT